MFEGLVMANRYLTLLLLNLVGGIYCNKLVQSAVSCKTSLFASKYILYIVGQVCLLVNLKWSRAAL